MDIEIGKIYFYNNGPVKVIQAVSDNFVIVETYLPVDSGKLQGKDFCVPCMVGGKSTHTCDLAQEVIDVMIENYQTSYIFYVPIELLQSTPYEVVEYTGLKNDITELKVDISELKKRKKELQEDKELKKLNNMKIEKDKIDNEIKELRKIKDNVTKEYEKLLVDIDEKQKEINIFLGVKSIESNKKDNRFNVLEME